MPRPKGYVTPQEEKDRIAASRRRTWDERQRPQLVFAKRIADAASRGDMPAIYAVLDRYVAEQGHTLTDEDITAMMKAMLSSLRDKDAAIRQLSRPTGPTLLDGYTQGLRTPSPAERLSIQKRMQARHEGRR